MRVLSKLLLLGFTSGLLITEELQKKGQAQNVYLKSSFKSLKRDNRNDLSSHPYSAVRQRSLQLTVGQTVLKKPDFSLKNSHNSTKFFLDSVKNISSLSKNESPVLRRKTTEPAGDRWSDQKLINSLEIINKIEDLQVKSELLIELAINYYYSRQIKRAKKILDQSLETTNLVEETAKKIPLLITIAGHYANLSQIQKANELLAKSLTLINGLEDQQLQSQLLMKLSLKYAQLGQEKRYHTLLSQSQRLMEEASLPVADFPFKETPLQGNFGFNGSFNSFRDTTAFVGTNLNIIKQWQTEDLDFSANLYSDFDSSRSVNNYKPGGLILGVYRYHVSSQWNYFTNLFMAGNQAIFSSSTDDEDLTFIANLATGVGLNLWRGETPQEFLDFQVGIGPRYEYDYIDFEQRRNRVEPILFINFYGKGFAVGQGKLDTLFAIVPSLEDSDNYFITSRTTFSYPLSERWSLNNTLWMRYRNQRILIANPKLEVFFTTGINYKF